MDFLGGSGVGVGELASGGEEGRESAEGARLGRRGSEGMMHCDARTSGTVERAGRLPALNTLGDFVVIEANLPEMSAPKGPNECTMGSFSSSGSWRSPSLISLVKLAVASLFMLTFTSMASRFGSGSSGSGS